MSSTHYLPYKTILILASAFVIISLMSAPTFAQIDITNSTIPSIANNSTVIGGILAAKSNSTDSIPLQSLGKPLFIEHNKVTNATKNTPNSVKITFKGNGTLILPSGNVTTKDSGRAVSYTMEGFSRSNGRVVLKTPDGKENATATFTEYIPENATLAIGIVFIQTNSTGQLAPLNNMTTVFRDEIGPQFNTITLWKGLG